MTKLRIARGVVLLVAVMAAATARADDDEAEAAKKAVTDLVKDLEAKKDIAKKAEAAAKDHDLDLVMGSFKVLDKRGRGGLGAGKLGDGIEKAIENLGKKGVKPGDFKGLQKDLIKLARVNVAIAEMAQHYADARAKNDEKKKLWKKYNEEMKKSAQALLKAAEAGQAAKIKALATDLNASCTGCHGEFRPNN